MTLIAQFLQTQYRQQIHVARLAAAKTGNARWKPDWRMLSSEHFDARVLGGDQEPLFDGYGEIVTAEYVVSHDPFRTIADVEAKLNIVHRHAACGTGSGYCDDGGHPLEGGGCADLADLARPFAGHPAYRPEWRQ